MYVFFLICFPFLSGLVFCWYQSCSSVLKCTPRSGLMWSWVQDELLLATQNSRCCPRPMFCTVINCPSTHKASVKIGCETYWTTQSRFALHNKWLPVFSSRLNSVHWNCRKVLQTKVVQRMSMPWPSTDIGLAHQRTMLRARCGRVIQRSDGCDNMQCGRHAYSAALHQEGCGHQFSWSQAPIYQPTQESRTEMMLWTWWIMMDKWAFNM